MYKRKVKIKWSHTSWAGWIWITISLCLLPTIPIRYKNAVEMEKSDHTYSLEIVDMDCDENTKSKHADAWIEVRFRGKLREFPMDQSSCLSYYTGDMIKRKYNPEKDLLYIVGSQISHAKSFGYFVLSSLFLSLLPWSWWEQNREEKWSYKVLPLLFSF